MGGRGWQGPLAPPGSAPGKMEREKIEKDIERQREGEGEKGRERERERKTERGRGRERQREGEGEKGRERGERGTDPGIFEGRGRVLEKAGP